MATIHELTEDWQREGLSPTWVKLQQARAEFDALQKQMESQKDEWLSWQAKREGLEADAARYRWLKDNHPELSGVGDFLDAAIDAEIREQ